MSGVRGDEVEDKDKIRICNFWLTYPNLLGENLLEDDGQEVANLLELITGGGGLTLRKVEDYKRILESHNLQKHSSSILPVEELQRLKTEIKKLKTKSEKPSEKVVIIQNKKSECKKLIEDAEKNFELSKQLLKEERWNFVVKQGIDCMELSLKSILGLIIGKYPKTHRFQEKLSKKLYIEAMKIVKDGVFDNTRLFLTRLFFIPSMWSESYTNAKYGDVWSTNVYTELEGKFIIKQAEEFLKSAEEIYDEIIGW